MATTWNRTFTTVLTVGEKLAQEKQLENVRNELSEIEKKYEDDIQRLGIKIKETDEIGKIGTIIYQWDNIMRAKLPEGDKISEIVAQLKKVEGNEKGNEFKLR